MTDLNVSVLIGRVTRDIGENDFGYLPNGTARMNTSIAVNRSVKKGDSWTDEVSYFDITIWGKTAENLKPYIKKGTQISVQGYLKQDRWEKEGRKMSKVVIVANEVRLLGGKPEGQGGQPQGQSYGQPAPANADGFPEDIPF
ncbi:MAG: single-stranded DNA-binding protein [Treponema sp.]|nr:single-stranded DNA-binding protein [Treponema sp.]